MIRKSARSSLPATLVLLTAAAFIAVPAWQLLFAGPFAWHVSQPAFWQGGLEACVLAVLCAAGLVFAPRRRGWLGLAAVGVAFYLRRHSIDVPLLLDVLQIEIVIGLGACVRRVFRLAPPDDARGYLQSFVLGFVAWSLCAWMAAACGVGSIGDLRALTLLLAIPAAFGRHAPLVVHLWRRARAGESADRAWHGVLAAWVAVLYARSKVAYGHDSLWYGLRAEFVLAPGDSIYEPLGLVSPVHYFPKLYEMFLLPLARLGDASVLSGITIWMLVLLLLACAVLMDRLGLPRHARLPVLALVATLPALANATTPKPDVIAVLFVMLAADAAAGFIQSRSPRDGAWLLACGTLACLAKLTAIPYIGVLVLAALAAAWRGRHDGHAGRDDPRERRLAVGLAAATLAVAGFVTARTYLLTGLPTIGPDPLFKAWTVLGFELAAPAGTLRWTYPQAWSDVPALLLDWWFRPQRLPHIVVSWVGNVWLWSAAVAFALAIGARRIGAAPLRRDPAQWALGALAVTGALLAVGVRYHARGSDGNYFLAALLPAILLSSTALFRHGQAGRLPLAAAFACLPAFALFQAGYAFMSGGWTPGTRALDLELGRTWKGQRETRPGVLASAGLTAIGDRLRAEPDAVRSVGYVQEPASFWLPGRFEHLRTISYSRAEFVDDPDQFLAYLREQRIDYLILPLQQGPEADDVAPAVSEAAHALRSLPEVERIEDRAYAMLDLRAWRTHSTPRAAGGNLRAPLR